MGRFMAAAALLSGMLLGACSDGGSDRDEAVDELVETGQFTQEQAECFVDGVIDEFGEDRINDFASEDEPVDFSPEEEDALANITIECLS